MSITFAIRSRSGDFSGLVIRSLSGELSRLELKSGIADQRSSQIKVQKYRMRKKIYRN